MLVVVGADRENFWLYTVGMSDALALYKWFEPEKVQELLAQAQILAQSDPELGWYKIQSQLEVGQQAAVVILDWLADKGFVKITITNHWIRAGKTYARNNIAPNLAEMQDSLRVGEQRALAIMRALVQKRVIEVTPEFDFVLIKRAATFADLVRQLKIVAKRYRGRCEAQLLMRVMFIDPITATRLAQYGEEYLGLYWKNKKRIRTLTSFYED